MKEVRSNFSLDSFQLVLDYFNKQPNKLSSYRMRSINFMEKKQRIVVKLKMKVFLLYLLED